LVPKKQDLGFKPRARPEQVGYQHCNGMKDCEHRLLSWDDSARARESSSDGIFGKDRLLRCAPNTLLLASI
jgi:hypothetical protein